MIILKQISERSAKADMIIDTIAQSLYKYNKIKIDNSKDIIYIIIWSKDNVEIDFTLNAHFNNEYEYQTAQIKTYIFDYITYTKADIQGKIDMIRNFCEHVYNLNDSDINLYRKLYSDINKAIEIDQKLRPPLPRANKKRKKQIQKIIKNYNKSIYSDFYKKDYENLK